MEVGKGGVKGGLSVVLAVLIEILCFQDLKLQEEELQDCPEPSTQLNVTMHGMDTTVTVRMQALSARMQ